MHTILNFVTGLSISLIFCLYTALYAGSCKNSAASHRPDTISKANTVTHATAQVKKNAQEEDDVAIASEQSGHKTLKDKIAVISAPHLQPHFTLNDVIIETGSSQSITLEVPNRTEGYIIKSISVTKGTTTSYVKQFGLESLTNKSIPSDGLTFTLTANQHLKLGTYLLGIKLGTLGIGSKATEQFIDCNITISSNNQHKQEYKVIKQTGSSNKTIDHTRQTAYKNSIKQEKNQVNKQIKQENNKHKSETTCSVSDPTPSTTNYIKASIPSAQPIPKIQTAPIWCLFTEKADNEVCNTFECKIGNAIIIHYDLTPHKQTEYKIKKVQIIRQPNGKISSSKKLFGLADYPNKVFEKQIIVSPSITKPDLFQLTITIQGDGNQPVLHSRCNLAFFK